MYLGKTLFAQVMDFLPWKTVHRIVGRYGGDTDTKPQLRRVSTVMQFRPCPTPAEHKRIAPGASDEAEMSPLSPNDSNFNAANPEGEFDAASPDPREIERIEAYRREPCAAGAGNLPGHWRTLLRGAPGTARRPRIDRARQPAPGPAAITRSRHKETQCVKPRRN